MKKGFTLIELLVVVAIIAILAAILFPVFAQAKEAAKKTGCASNMKQIGTAVAIYQADYDDGYPNTGDPWLWAGRRFRWPIMPYLGIGQKREDGTFNATSVSRLLTCPSEASGAGFNSTSYALSAAFYLTPDQVAQLRIRNLVSSLNDPGAAAFPMTQTSSNVVSPGEKGLVTEWFNNHHHGAAVIGFWGTLGAGLSPGANRWEGGRNMLFADLHLKWMLARRQTPSVQDCPDFNLTPGGIEGSDIRK
jgi:prepilin-type N-terminal cleavage/methylation domain-containing protein